MHRSQKCINASEAKKIKERNTPFYFACFNCKDNVKKADILRAADTDRRQINDLKRHCEAKISDMNENLQIIASTSVNFGSSNQDLQLQLELAHRHI